MCRYKYQIYAHLFYVWVHHVNNGKQERSEVPCVLVPAWRLLSVCSNRPVISLSFWKTGINPLRLRSRPPKVSRLRLCRHNLLISFFSSAVGRVFTAPSLSSLYAYYQALVMLSTTLFIQHGQRQLLQHRVSTGCTLDTPVVFNRSGDLKLWARTMCSESNCTFIFHNPLFP